METTETEETAKETETLEVVNVQEFALVVKYLVQENGDRSVFSTIRSRKF